MSPNLRSQSFRMSEREKAKLKVFDGKREDNYTLWRKRAELALQSEGYWEEAQKEKPDKAMLQKAAAIIVNGLGDTAFQICDTLVPDVMKMLAALDERYASKRATSQIAIIDTILRKRFSVGDDMETYVNEFESLFSQLQQVKSETTIPEVLKGPLLLSSIQYGTGLESMAAALRTKTVEDLTWKSVSADLIEENRRVKQARKERSMSEEKSKPHMAKAAKTCEELVCVFCGKRGHEADRCYLNPESETCKLTEQAKKNLAKKANTAQIRFGY